MFLCLFRTNNFEFYKLKFFFYIYIGYIERGIIPKSQGRVPYRDARKSTWGDLFPHEPKNPATRRYIPQSIEQSDIKGVKSKKKDQVRIPSGQQSIKSVKKKIRSLRRKERPENEDNV